MQIIWLERADYVAYITAEGWLSWDQGGSERSLTLGLAALDPVAMWWLGLTYELETTLVWSPSSSCDCPLAFYVSLDLSCSLSGQSTGLEEENNLLQGWPDHVYFALDQWDIEIHLCSRKYINIPHWFLSQCEIYFHVILGPMPPSGPRT